jgi:hypothetical protein
MLFIINLNLAISFFCSRTVHLDIIKVLLPTDAQENCLFMQILILLLKPIFLCISW